MDGTSVIVAFATPPRFTSHSCTETVMRSSPAAKTLVVSPEDRKTLQRWIRMPTAPQRLVLRSRIVLMLADGCPAREVARRLGVSRPTVSLWRRRYMQEGCDVLTRDRPGRGRPRAAAKQPLVASQRNLSATRHEEETARDGNWLYRGDDSASRDRSAPHQRRRSSERKR
jgi:hypothetical protein